MTKACFGSARVGALDLASPSSVVKGITNPEAAKNYCKDQNPITCYFSGQRSYTYGSVM